MFTASITSKDFKGGVMQVVVQFSDGTDTVVKAFNISSENDLKRQVKNEINRLNELSSFSKVLSVGAYTTPKSESTPPTQAQLDKEEWFRDFGRLENALKLVTMGVLNESTPALVALKNKVTTNFKPAYIAEM